MFYLFILESIGTSELILIGLVALIVFGPRKLPELARKLGKAMNEFRRTTDDFKQTWAREVDFEFEGNSDKEKLNSISENTPLIESSIQRNTIGVMNEIVAPEIKEIKQTDFEENFAKKEINTKEPESNQTNKRDWL
ncbi:Sec-independent protein translocase protein TatB [soil metagenome]|jgi:TatA/E family protein of Tat protein translocase|nr:twin-arginine translocase TatA/TatE family subunit [Pyrinomonadaceae bacterium]